jgi:aminopeptidase N
MKTFVTVSVECLSHRPIYVAKARAHCSHTGCPVEKIKMKPETPRPVLLADYKPPAYLISKVDLSIALDPTRTRVKARSKVSRNPKSTAPRGLRLDGEFLELESLAIDGKELAVSAYAMDDTGLTIHAPHA